MKITGLSGNLPKCRLRVIQLSPELSDVFFKFRATLGSYFNLYHP